MKALGERVCDEKIAGRRALFKAWLYKTPFARVFGDFLQRIPRVQSMPTNREQNKPEARPPSRHKANPRPHKASLEKNLKQACKD